MPKLTDQEYLLLAYEVATKSPDPSTQNGAVIPYLVTWDYPEEEGWAGQLDEELLAACNTFPEGVLNKPERLERPLKYNFIEHAERGVILLAAKMGVALDGLTMYVPWFACSDCARAIICSGIKKVVGHQRMMDATPDHWKESIAHAFTMLNEAGVEIVLIPDVLNGPQIMFNGQLWTP
jgi:dCMP deaminase